MQWCGKLSGLCVDYGHLHGFVIILYKGLHTLQVVSPQHRHPGRGTFCPDTNSNPLQSPSVSSWEGHLLPWHKQQSPTVPFCVILGHVPSALTQTAIPNSPLLCHPGTCTFCPYTNSNPQQSPSVSSWDMYLLHWLQDCWKAIYQMSDSRWRLPIYMSTWTCFGILAYMSRCEGYSWG